MSSSIRIIACSNQNIASENMHALLVKEFGFTKTTEVFDNLPIYSRDNYLLITVKGTILDLEPLTQEYTPEVYLVASSHKSTAGENAHCVHSTGNWEDAKMGGKPRTLCLCAPLFARAALLHLQKTSPPEYPAQFEVTHHGPSDMNAPVVFVEVGSGEDAWNDIAACRRVCEAILAFPEEKPVAIGIGGTHYTPNFSKQYVLEQYALGHICPKWAVDALDVILLRSAIQMCVPRAQIALLDWKGLTGEQRMKVIKLCDELCLPWKKVHELKSVS